MKSGSLAQKVRFVSDGASVQSIQKANSGPPKNLGLRSVNGELWRGLNACLSVKRTGDHSKRRKWGIAEGVMCAGKGQMG